jgi:hypothetical protein
MNEESKRVWSRPLQGWRRILCWFGLLVMVTFLTVLCLAYVSGGKKGNAHLTLAALITAAVLVGLILFIRWLCCWRNFRRFLFGITCFATLIALFYAEENWRGQRAWEKYRRTWEAKGEKFDLASLAPPPVPDAQNFAMTPLLKQALDFTRTPNGIVWRDTNAQARLNDISMENASSAAVTNRLAGGSLEQGTFADLEACANFYRGNANYPQPAQTASAAETILTAVGKYDAELAELVGAAAARPSSRFLIEYDYEMPAAILLPHLAVIKKLCITTQLRAIARLEKGQSADALADLQLGLRLSDSIHDEPILISHLVRIATLGIDLQTVREGLTRHAWDDSQLAALEKYLASVNLFAELKNAMRGERALGVGCMEWARRQGLKFNLTEFVGDAPAIARFSNLMPRGWFYQNMLANSQMHQDFTIATTDENNRRVLPAVVAAGDAAIADLARHRLNPCKIFVALLFPAINKAVIKSARLQTYVDTARVACALERYRLANGQLPDNLDALAPRFMSAIPNDVMDGQPLRYRQPGAGGYILYSIGWNQNDDGGRVARKDDKERSVDSQKGDWVWQMPAKLISESIAPKANN